MYLKNNNICIANNSVYIQIEKLNLGVTKMKKNEDYLTAREISRKLGIAQSTIYAILHYDKLESEKIGELTIVRKNVLEEWEKKNISPKDKAKEGGKKK
jgi:excisionase family DNA binding protein